MSTRPRDLVTKTRQTLKPRRKPPEVKRDFVPAEWGPADPERKPDGVTVRQVVIDNETGETVEGTPLPDREPSEAQRAGVAVEAALAPGTLPDSYIREQEAKRRSSGGYQRGGAPVGGDE